MLLIVFLFVRIFAPDVADSYKEKIFTINYEFNSEWKCTKNSDGIALYERWITVNDSLRVRERKGEMVVNCSYEDVVRFLSQYQTMPEWMSSVAHIERIAGSDRSDTVVYIVFGLPWPMDNRDIAGTFKVYQLDKQNCIIKMEGVKDVVKKHAGRVRLNNYEASWNLVRIDEHRTKIVLNTFSDEPPLFPLCVQDPIIRKVFYGNLLKLKKRLALVK